MHITGAMRWKILVAEGRLVLHLVLWLIEWREF